MVILNASISLNKVQELAKKQKAHSNGDTYVPVTVFVGDQLNKIGKQVEIKESTTKEEREALKAKGEYPTNIGGGWVAMDGQVVKVEKDGDDLPF